MCMRVSVSVPVEYKNILETISLYYKGLVVEYLKAYNCVPIICIKNSYLKL